jgi:hypothetical protein
VSRNEVTAMKVLDFMPVCAGENVELSSRL